ncbi:MAG: hypothetical protein AB8H79_26795 [Myxococcota bacterium]
MRTILLSLALVTTPALAGEPPETATVAEAVPADAPLQGEVRFHVDGMKRSGDGF